MMVVTEDSFILLDAVCICTWKGDLPRRWVFVERLRRYTHYVILMVNACNAVGMINVHYYLQHGWPFLSSAELSFYLI